MLENPIKTHTNTEDTHPGVIRHSGHSTNPAPYRIMLIQPNNP
jgi:hypothetical protein